ncbi:hypothetical protein [Furfurilactobacillus rossiae]
MLLFFCGVTSKTYRYVLIFALDNLQQIEMFNKPASIDVLEYSDRSD